MAAPYLIGMQKLLQMYDPKGYTVTVRQLDIGVVNNYRATLRRVKLTNELNIIAHCSAQMLPELLKQAQQVGLMSDSHNWFITSLDLHTVDLEPFMHGGTNITGLRLIDPEDPDLERVTSFWQRREREKGHELSPLLEPQSLSTQVALTYDSVLMFAMAFDEMQGTRHIETISLSCDNEETLVGGYSFQNIMKTSKARGLTRDISFDHKGRRTEFTLDIVELDSAGLTKIGEWNATHRVTLARLKLPSSSAGDEGSLRNRSFVVLTALVGKKGGRWTRAGMVLQLIDRHLSESTVRNA